MGTQRYFDFLQSERYNLILNYDAEQLEDDHAFIQWIFPTTAPSAFNADAPVIDVAELRQSEHFEDARIKMRASLALMKKHWGMNFFVDKKKLRLLTGHNGLRFSRVLQSLVYHDLADEALKILQVALDHKSITRPAILRGSATQKTIWEDRFEAALKEVQEVSPSSESNIADSGNNNTSDEAGERKEEEKKDALCELS